MTETDGTVRWRHRSPVKKNPRSIDDVPRETQRSTPGSGRPRTKGAEAGYARGRAPAAHAHARHPSCAHAVTQPRRADTMQADTTSSASLPRSAWQRTTRAARAARAATTCLPQAPPVAPRRVVAPPRARWDV
ncbi:hypothetical protein BU14_0244s0023 [Porphyra umbilicalis]|uniref:Uncharacterized protein n=1 Tax=Porphyra umbilicalis TaxID=2786 RepID=A0A1X6P2X1_PORUM|nr:hypothetical protein BU14_0244s0023 [Porphyra umbilicalis]|eukprot:OSX75262.1 hypothetical protein BU14_0244s0023 [Porphyra umbilicalis]